MSRLIDADALMTDLDQTIRVSAREENSAEMRGIRKVLDRIKAAPTLSPDEVRGVGEWIKASTFERCPSCGYETGKRGTASKYCPDCGMRLRMKGAEDGTTD